MRSIRCMVFFALGLCLACGSAASPSQLELEVAFPHLTFVRPVDFQHPGDGTNRLFVVEQRGIIWVFENNPTTTTRKKFLDIQDRVDDSGNEMGLLGLAFHPNFENNGYFYVDYTAGNPRRTVISRFQVSASNPDSADRNSELVLLTVNQPYSNHNGGQIGFGPDGFLYISLGDGGLAGDPQNNGQNRATLLGSLLRIDVNTTSGNLNYGIPPDNPFAGNTNGWREEIFAYGLRNMWRFSFDPVTGWLWGADVGQDAWEEIDIIRKGKNYGWRIVEGRHCFNPPSNCDTSGLEMPIWEYPHSQGQSITGGFVYRGPSVPELIGKYVYADFVNGRIWALTYDGGSAANTLLMDTNLKISSFGVDARNELYICAFDGKIYRFKPTVTGLLDPAESVKPKAFALGANYPNPFNPETHIPFFLPLPSRVQLEIFDAQGKRVRTLLAGFLGAGHHSLRWNGTNDRGEAVASGVYLYRLVGPHMASAFRKMVLVK